MGVIYLTGTAATGKTTLLRALSAEYDNVEPFSYSDALAKHVNALGSISLNEVSIRSVSGAAITAEHVREVDAKLLALCESRRANSTVVIDSHPLTKEAYGFRITAFSRAEIEALRPDCIICLYCSPEVISERTSKDSGGRPNQSHFEYAFSAALQASIAAAYAINANCPVYLFDASVPADQLVVLVANKIGLKLGR